MTEESDVFIPEKIADSGLAGKMLLPREIADELKPYWSNYELTKGIATCLGESAGYIGAWHDNIDDVDNVVSRDCGLMQINIPANKIGSTFEFSLRIESLVPEFYELVVKNNVEAAHALYDQPWTRDGKTDIRRWQPWVAYNSGWATFPEWWVWHQTDGEPTGPWMKAPRYIQRAIVGQMNRKVKITGEWTVQKAYQVAVGYAEHFGVEPGLLYVTDSGTVAFHAPPMPTDPPVDGVGPRPVPNDGL